MFRGGRKRLVSAKIGALRKQGDKICNCPAIEEVDAAVLTK